MKRLLDQLKNSNSTTELKLSLLLDLEYMVHQVSEHAFRPTRGPPLVKMSFANFCMFVC